MLLSGKAADRLVWAALYVGIFAVTIWAGTLALNYSQDSRFYREYVAGWGVAVQNYSQANGRWPAFTGDQASYMDGLVSLMQGKGVEPPPSNTGRRYVYLLRKWARENENVLVFCRPGRVYLYGLSDQTFGHLDNFIDDGGGAESGNFVGRALDDGTYIGQWNL